MAAAYGVPVEIIRKTLKEFQGVEHRIEFVAEKDGVVYYNEIPRERTRMLRSRESRQ